jgi:hypothetical protein
MHMQFLDWIYLAWIAREYTVRAQVMANRTVSGLSTLPVLSGDSSLLVVDALTVAFSKQSYV